MVPIPVYWTEYTATQHGSAMKTVPCENCSTVYVYLLERKTTGVGTSMYFLNEQGAADHAVSAAQETLKSELENDFDAVPCPVCGHYQRYMFPKLMQTKGLWGVVVMLVLLLAGCLNAVSAVYWTAIYLFGSNERALEKMLTYWGVVAAVSVIGFVLWIVKQARFRRFDPNREDQQARIARGRSRAITQAEWEKAQQGQRDPQAGPETGIRE
jgi:hypothetical protein